MLMRLGDMFQCVNPSSWFAYAIDENGEDFCFSAKQFLESFNSNADETMLPSMVYEVIWEDKIKISRYAGLQHYAATCNFYTDESSEARETDLSSLSVEEYAKRNAMIYEAVEMSTDSDYVECHEFCMKRILPHHMRLLKIENHNVEWQSKFVEIWTAEFIAASVRRMKRLAVG